LPNGKFALHLSCPKGCDQKLHPVCTRNPYRDIPHTYYCFNCRILYHIDIERNTQWSVFGYTDSQPKFDSYD